MNGEFYMPPMEQNDHDLLISLNTKMEMLIRAMGDYNNQYASLSARVAVLETRDGRDSEKFTAMQRDMGTWMQSASEVPSLKTEIKNMTSLIEDLQAKSNTWSVLNSVGVAVVAIFTALAWMFGR